MKNTFSGFSLVEVMVVVGIIVVLASLSVAAFAGFSRRQALDAETEALANTLRDARSATLASVGGSQYGVALRENGFSRFKGNSFDPLDPDNDIFDFSPWVRATSTISEVVFERLTGNSTASGTIDVYLAGDPASKRTVSISGTGLVGVR